MISQEEFQAQREALSTRQTEGEEAEADDMLFQMDEQPSTQPPLGHPQAKTAEASLVSEWSDSSAERAMLEESTKKTPPTSPLRFYPLPDKSEASTAKDKVCVGVNAGHWCIQFSLVMFEVLSGSPVQGLVLVSIPDFRSGGVLVLGVIDQWESSVCCGMLLPSNQCVCVCVCLSILQTPQKQKTKYSANPPVESPVGWVLGKKTAEQVRVGSFTGARSVTSWSVCGCAVGVWCEGVRVTVSYCIWGLWECCLVG